MVAMRLFIEIIMDNKSIESFEDFNLKEDLLRGIFAHGFNKPSEIQKQVIPAAVEGHNIIAQAEPGSGKTGAFVISVLQRIDQSVNRIQAILLAPTRELAQQTNNIIISIGDFMGAKCCACIGGKNVRDDIIKIESGMQIIVGTPGRVKYIIKKGHIEMQYIKIFVLDEADIMLSRDFQEYVCDCLGYLEPDTQIFLLSVTMPDEAMSIANSFVKTPLRILIKNEGLNLEGIRQLYVDCGKDEYKFDTLVDLYQNLSIKQAVIFCNYNSSVVTLNEKLNEQDFLVSAVHTELNQATRDERMIQFRDGCTRVLITTDLLCRGIDVQNISIVINYDLPKDKRNYIHRIGRCARYGRKGVVLNFVTDRDFQAMKQFESFYNTTIRELPMNLSEFL